MQRPARVVLVEVAQERISLKPFKESLNIWGQLISQKLSKCRLPRADRPLKRNVHPATPSADYEERWSESALSSAWQQVSQGKKKAGATRRPFRFNSWWAVQGSNL